MVVARGATCPAMPVIEGLEHLRLIGGGGFADVFAAHEPAFSRDVAVKLFRSRVGDADRDSFGREAQAMGRLSGIRNVVQVYRCGITEDQHPFLVMELMRGSMQDRLLEGPMPVGDVCAVGVLIGRSLAEAHARGILHRDIKPANVLIDRYGEPALSDFGISSLPGAGASASIAAFTAEHAPPEVFEEGRSTAASDVYSFASTLCTLMDGHPPFARTDDEGPLTFMQRVKDTPCPTSLAASAHSSELELMLRSAMAKTPADRPTLDDVVAVLEQFASDNSSVKLAPDAARPVIAPTSGPATGLPPTDHPQTDPPKNRSSSAGATAGASPSRRRPLLIAAAVVALLAGAIAVWASTADDAEVAADGDDPGATTTITSDTAPIAPDPRLPDGVSDAMLIEDPDINDTSGILRSKLNAFGAASDVPAVAAGPVSELTGEDLEFGRLPARLDYAATNGLDTTTCLRVIMNDLVVRGAAAAVWLDGRQVVLVSAIQTDSVIEARRYFWATTLFIGLRDVHCDGWPENRIAIDPDDLAVTRADFDLVTPTDDVLTAIDGDPDIEGIKSGISYEAVFRIDDVLIVASVGWQLNSEGADPAAAVAVLDDVVAAFSTP